MVKMNSPQRYKWPSNNELPPSMLSSWQKDGFLIVDNFYSKKECEDLKNHANKLISNFDPEENKVVFSTTNQSHSSEDYFLNSGDKIRFFLEDGALKNDGSLNRDKFLAINKIGHAMHDLDEKFSKFSRKKSLAMLSNAIGIETPLLLQSMYICKQPYIGGEVTNHQDSSFIYTEPESCVGFWVAIEDATIENGCMWAVAGGHKEPLRQRFLKVDNKMKMVQVNETPMKKADTPLEAPAGSLILLHGRLPHLSGSNTSSKSRHAYALHVIDGRTKYSSDNWLQRDSKMPLKGFIDI